MHISCFVFAALLWGLISIFSHIAYLSMLFSMLWICTSVLNISFFDAMDLYECFRYKFSQNDGRRRIFSFYRKIYKAAPILISGWFYKSFSFTLLALCDGTTAQLQIYSSERNIRLLPVGWRKDNLKNVLVCIQRKFV